MSEALADVREGFTPKQIKMAIGVASDKRYAGGNMTGAVKAIEKIKKGLSDHPQVAAVLKRQNEKLDQEDEPFVKDLVKKLRKGSATHGKQADDLEKALDEDGHTDVASAKTQVKVAMSAMNKMNTELSKLNDEDSLPSWWTNKVAVAVDKLDGMADYLDTQVEEVELDEAKSSTGYELYHNSFANAMSHAYTMAKKIHRVDIDRNEIDDKVATGPRKPSVGKTNKYRLKGKGGVMQIQVYNSGNKIKPYELNMYKEGVELDEGKMKQFHMMQTDGKSAEEIAKALKLDLKTVKALMKEEETVVESWELDEMKMDDPKLLKIFDKLKKGSTVKIKIDSSISKGKDYREFTVTAKNIVGKGKRFEQEKITLKSKDNPTGVKHFLYNRDGKVTLAIGDMGASIADIKENKMSAYTAAITKGVK